MSWVITILSIIGVILNIKKNKYCFYIWSVTNASWAIYDWYKGLYAQSVLFMIYFVLAIWGLAQWYIEERKGGINK